jgi:hypothetical protein
MFSRLFAVPVDRFHVAAVPLLFQRVTRGRGNSVRHGCDKASGSASVNHIMSKATDISNLKRVKPGEMIRVGSIWMPIENLPQALAPFTKLLFCLTGSEDHPYSLRGSATGFEIPGPTPALLLPAPNCRSLTS